jgi:hypothetical protein
MMSWSRTSLVRESVLVVSGGSIVERSPDTRPGAARSKTLG